MTEQVQFVRGLNEMATAFKKLPRTLAAKYLGAALSPAAKLIKNDAQVRAPYYTGPIRDLQPPPGTLRRAIIIKRVTNPSVEEGTLQATYVITVRHGARAQSVGKKKVNLDAYYWWFVEHGTSKMRAQPFLRTAFDADKFEALGLIEEGLATGVKKAADEHRWWMT
jgi:HK97 gp10 family phage protein